MTRRSTNQKWFRLLSAVCVLAIAACAYVTVGKAAGPGIPERIGKWRVEVGLPGNELYKAPEETKPTSTTKSSSSKKAATAARDPQQEEAELRTLLEPYRQRFDMQGQIQRLISRPVEPGQGYRFVVIGDSRSQWELWSNIVKHIDQLDPKPRFVINTGDIVLSGYAQQYHDYLVPPLLETDIPYLVAIGNHDDGDDGKAREYRYLFGENSLNYYFDYGKTRYVLFDNVTSVQASGKTLEWLDQTVAATPKGYRKWVFGHRPPATVEKWAYHAWGKEESKTFTDLMTKHSVDEVFHGHIHAYSTATLDGIPYTVTGGGGAGLHNRYGPLGSVHHYVICDVGADGTVKQQVVRFYDAAKESQTAE